MQIEATRILDDLALARSPEDGLRRIDAWRSEMAPGSIFSIQQNVTTAAHPAGEIWLRRFYSSEAQEFPVNGGKRKSLTPWTECVFVRGQVFVGEGAHVLEQHFDDYAQMRPLGLQSVVNVPLLRDNSCYATFNVFAPQAAWDPKQVTGFRLLALVAARWVPAAPDLACRLTVPASMEA